jgi:beta-phosphoglucomutase
MIKALFFDFNGVIIDDERLQMTAYQDVLRGHGIELTEQHYWEALGMDDRTFIRTALERAGKSTPELNEIVFEEKIVIHRKMIEDELPLFPGVVTFIKSAARHFSLGIVSMADDNEVGYVIDRAGLREFFSITISADDVNVCKPAPDCYAGGLQKLNLKRQEQRLLPLLPHECVAIEDSPPGIASGRAAGMKTLGITNTVSEKELRDAGADVVTARLSDWTPDAVRHVFG